MQRLLSRILAGEVQRPGSFSRITLATVKNLGREDLECFATAVRYAWRTQERRSKFEDVFIPLEDQWLTDEIRCGCSYDVFLRLDGLGVMNCHQISVLPEHYLRHDDLEYTVFNAKRQEIGALSFTPAGVELMGVFPSELDPRYHAEFLSLLARKDIATACPRR